MDNLEAWAGSVNVRHWLGIFSFVIVAAGFPSALFVMAFRNHRARYYNAYAIVSIVLVAASAFRVNAGGEQSNLFTVIVWGNLAFCMVLGFLAMVWLAFGSAQNRRITNHKPIDPRELPPDA